MRILYCTGYVIFGAISMGLCVMFDMMTLRRDNKRLADGYWNFTVPSFTTCLVHCQFFTACLSINFYRTSDTCELNEATETENPDGLVDVVDVVYGEKTSQGLISQVVPSGCQSSPCKGRERCVPTATAYTCIIEDCGKPRVREQVTHTPTARPYRVGSSIEYTCSGPYISITGSSVDTCSAEGLWEPDTYTCTACTAPPAIMYASYSSGVTSAGTVVTYACNCPIPSYAGTAMQDDPTIRCLPDGTWSPVSFTCLTDCYTAPARIHYTGSYNRTVSDAPCQNWNVNTPHENLVSTSDSSYADGSIDAAKNFCRAPCCETIEHPPWCYTNIPGEPRWEYCGVPLCSDCY